MIFLEFSCFFYGPTDVGNLISGSSAFSKSSLNIWNFLVHIVLKLSLDNFEHGLVSMWNECNCAVVWTFFGIAFLWDLSENWPFPVLWPLLCFPNVLAYWWKQSPVNHWTTVQVVFTHLSMKTLCAPGPRRKEQWPHKRLIQTCLWVSMSLQQSCRSAVACYRVKSTDTAGCAWHFWRRSPYLHYFHH